MEAVNKSHWRSLKKFVGYALKKAERYGLDEDDQIRLRILLGLMSATDERQKDREYSLFEGEGLTETFSISVNQIFEGYCMPADDYLIAHTRFREERPYVRGLAFDFGKYGLMYEGNKDLFDVMYCTSGSVFAVAELLVSEVLLYRIGDSVERMPRYLQELYQKAFDSARAAYEQSNCKSEHVFRFAEECAKKVPEISRAEYDTILLHAAKISNGQHDCIPILRRELKDKLNINDAEPLVEDLVRNKDIEFLNRVRLFLSQYPFVVENEEGVRYQLVKRGNFCGLDFVEESAERAVDETPARAIEEEKVVEEVTLETRAERIRRLQADVQRGIIEIGFELIAAKKQVGHGGWADWLQREFEWTQQTANRFMRVAERFGKLNNVVQFKPSTLQAMLALPEGDEEAFIAAQAQAGTPVENQSARQVQESVKKWKSGKEQKSAPPFDQINLFPEAEEVGIQSDDEGKSDNYAEYASNPEFDSSDSEKTTSPTEESDAREKDGTFDEQNPSQSEKKNILLETLPVNSDDKEETTMLDETQKVLGEIGELIKKVSGANLVETVKALKVIRDFLKQKEI